MVWCCTCCFHTYRNRQATRHMWTREDESELSDLFEQYKDDNGEQAAKCESGTVLEKQWALLNEGKL